LYNGSGIDFASLKLSYERFQQDFSDIKQHTERTSNESSARSAENAKSLAELRTKLTEMESQIKTLQKAIQKEEFKRNK
jgi:predicted  nucleic acid-binding Zn-ribbon protein